MPTLGDVKARVAALLGDMDRDWLTDAYLVPLVNQAYEGIYSDLALSCNPFETRVVVIPNVTAGETDLTSFGRTSGGPLYGLAEPLRLEWKPAGDPDTSYRPLRKYDELPDLAPSTGAAIFSTQLGWEWRASVIYITPNAVGMDLRLRGDFNPPALRKDEDVIPVPGMGDLLAYATAVLIAIERGNSGWAEKYATLAERQLRNVFALLVRQTQATTQRAGRMTRRYSR